MSIIDHINEAESQFIMCARCYSVHPLASFKDNSIYKTKESAIQAKGWFEFTDKPTPYLLCRNCVFSRKCRTLVAIIKNLLDRITLLHAFVNNKHDRDRCEICLAIQHATSVTKDFQSYVKTKHRFTYTENPCRKSSFDDSYDFLSDAEIAMLQKFSLLSLGTTSRRKARKGRSQSKPISQVSRALLNLPKRPNSFIHTKPASKILLDESDRKATEVKFTDISDDGHNSSIPQILTEQVVSEEGIELWDDEEDAGWSVIEIDNNSQDITISNWDDNLLTKEKEIESQVIPNSLLNEISDNAHDQPTNGQQNLLDNRKRKNNFCLPKRSHLNNGAVEAKALSRKPRVLSLLLMFFSSLALGMFLLILSFVLIRLFSQS